MQNINSIRASIGSGFSLHGLDSMTQISVAGVKGLSDGWVGEPRCGRRGVWGALAPQKILGICVVETIQKWHRNGAVLSISVYKKAWHADTVLVVLN